MSETNEDIVISKIETMPDWKCSFCGTINTSNTISCRQCKKTREQSDAHFFEMSSTDVLCTNTPETASPTSEKTFDTEAPPSLISSAFLRTHFAKFFARFSFFNRLPRRVKFALFATGAVVLVASAWLVLKTPSTHQASYKVAFVRWDRTIAIERYLAPKKAKNQTKVYMPFRTVKSEGSNNEPQWPNPELGKSAEGKPDKESKRTETYTVKLERETADNKISSTFPKLITITTSEMEFREIFRIGNKLVIKKDQHGNILPISKDSTIIKQSK